MLEIVGQCVQFNLISIIFLFKLQQGFSNYKTVTAWTLDDAHGKLCLWICDGVCKLHPDFTPWSAWVCRKCVTS